MFLCCLHRLKSKILIKLSRKTQFPGSWALARLLLQTSQIINAQNRLQMHKMSYEVVSFSGLN